MYLLSTISTPGTLIFAKCTPTLFADELSENRPKRVFVLKDVQDGVRTAPTCTFEERQKPKNFAGGK